MTTPETRMNRLKTTFLLVVLSGLLSSQAAGAVTADEQQGWMQSQVQRFRSYPHLDRAYQLMNEKKPVEARAEMERYLSLKPSDRTARTNYLLLLFQLKDYEATAREAGRLLGEKPESVPYLYRGMAREKLGDSGGALEDYRQAASAADTRAVDRTFALNQAVDLAIGMKRPDAALEALHALGESSSPYRYHLRRAMALEMKGDATADEAYERAAQAAAGPEQAARALEFKGEASKKAGDLHTAQNAFERALQAAPQSLPLLRALGEVTFAQKRYADTIRSTRLALQQKEDAADRERLVQALRETGRLAEAESELDSLLRTAAGAGPARLYILKAHLALDRGEPGVAKAALTNVLRLDPANLEATRVLAEMSGRAGNTREQLRYLQRIPLPKRSPEDIEVLAGLYLQSGDTRSAIWLYRKLLDTDYRKEMRYAYLAQLGKAYDAAGQPAQARKVLAEAVALRPDLPTAEKYVELLVKSGRTAEAVAELDRVAKGNLKAEDGVKLGVLYEKAGSSAKALDQLSNALGASLRPETAAQAHEQRAYIYRRMGRLEEARRDFEAALPPHGGAASVRVALGETCLALKDYPAAKASLLEARSQRGDAQIRLLLAQAFEGTGELSEALALYEELFRGTTDTAGSVALLASMADVETRLGRPAAAASRYLEAHAKSGDWRFLSHAVRSEIAAENWDAAQSLSARILAVDSLPREAAAEAWGQQAYLELRLHRPERAAESFGRAIAAGNDGWETHQKLGLVLYELGRRQEALDSFTASLQRHETARTLVYAARCAAELGKNDVALQYFQKTLDNPGELSEAELCAVRKEAGYLHFAARDYGAAAELWQQAIAEPDPVLAVQISQAWRLAERPADAQKWLPPQLPAGATRAVQAQYFDEAATQLKTANRAREAIANLSRAEELAPAADREFRLGSWYREQKDLKQSVVWLRRAAQRDDHNAVYRYTLAYTLLAQKKYKDAAAEFEAALRLAPDSTNLYRDLGYVYKRLSRNADASRCFRQALQQESRRPAQSGEQADVARREKGYMRQEIEVLDNMFDFTTFMAQSSDKRQVPPTAPAFGLGIIPSYAGTEVAFTPPRIGLRNGRLFQVYGRFLTNLEPGSLHPEPESYTMGLGARYKPLSLLNLFVSAEKFWGLNASAANNWMLRGMYSKDWGYDLQPGRDRWNYTLFYGDLAGYMKGPRVVIGYGEFRQGISLNVRDSLVITPHVMLDGRFYAVNKIADPYVEGGGGVSFKFYLRHGEYGLRRGSFEFLLHYRGGRVVGPESDATTRDFRGLAFTAIAAF